MRRSRGPHNRQPAVRSFKSPTSAASSTTTSAAPPDHCSRRRQTRTTGFFTGHRPRCTAVSMAMPTRAFALSRRVSADLHQVCEASAGTPTEFLIGTGGRNGRRTQERRNERSSVRRHNCRDVRETGAAASTPRLGEEKTRSASREAESKVIVPKGRIEFAAQRDTADSLRMAPRPAARGASHAVDGTGRIPLR